MRLIDADALTLALRTRRRDAAYFDDCGIEHDCLLRNDVINAIDIMPTNQFTGGMYRKVIEMAMNADTPQVVTWHTRCNGKRFKITAVAEVCEEAQDETD